MELTEFIALKSNLSDEECQVIANCFSPVKLAKGRHLLRQGQLVQAYYWVASGTIRVYYQESGREITGWIAFKEAFFTDLESIRSGTPTRFNFQAMEDTTLYSIPYLQLEKFYQTFPRMQQLGRKVWEDAFLGVLQAVLAFQSKDALERYLSMIDSKEVLQKIPLKHIASFVGVTPTSLSRLRNGLREDD